MSGPDRDVGFLLGLPFHVITMDDAIADAVRHIEAGRPGYYITPNADFIAQAHGDEALKDILFNADRVVCDGMPLVWLSKYFKPALPERVAGSDMVFRLFGEADKRAWKVYFLGSDSATLREAKAILNRDYPSMQVVGTFSPPFGPVDSWPNEMILDELADSQPDLLLVAVGCPKQEYWIDRFHRQSGVPLSVGIGASLDFICGTQTRAPLWVQKIGMEWCWRLMTNPKRLLKRYAKDFYFLIVLGWRQRKLMVHRSSRSVTNKPLISSAAKSASELCAPFEPDSANCNWLAWQGEVERNGIEAQATPDNYDHPVFLDLAEVSFIDSSGVGLLAKIAREARRANVPFGLIAPSEPVARIIDAMHLSSQFPIYQNREDALFALDKSFVPPATTFEKTFDLPPPFGRRDHQASLTALREAVDKVKEGESLVINISQLELLDSFALSRILDAYRSLRARGAVMKVVGASEQARQTLEMSGVHDFLCSPLNDV